MVAGHPVTLRSHDGLALALHRSRVDAPRCACLLVHGYAEHAGRYQELVRGLAGIGVETFAIDLRGHGRSEGVRADVRDYGEYLSDLQALYEHIAAERPGLPLLVFGHSMGGALALRFALEHGDALDALILSAPFLRPALAPPGWLLSIARRLAQTFPLLPVQRLDPRTLSRDPDVVEAYRKDPLTYTGRIRARMGHVMVASGPPLLERAGELGVPTLIVHGAADDLIDPRASEELAARIRPDLVTFRLYHGVYHELLNDLDRELVLADILAWIRAQPSLQGSSTRKTRNLR